MSRYWLGLGSNLGDRAEALQAAIDALAGEGVLVHAVSAVYETAPQDVVDQPAFLNAAAMAVSDLDPPGVLAAANALVRISGNAWDFWLRMTRTRTVHHKICTCAASLAGGDWRRSRPANRSDRHSLHSARLGSGARGMACHRKRRSG
jgi:hypothetical protein